MKKNILFLANYDKGWMGGVYYVKNQIAQLLSYQPARENLTIYLYGSGEIAAEYKTLLKHKNVHFIKAENIRKKLFYRLCKLYRDELDRDILDADLMYLAVRYRISYIFPYFPKGRINQRFLLKKSISWIPDFQHVHYPQFFSKNEYRVREREFYEISRKHNRLVLSSQDACRDFKERYHNDSKRVYVIPFCSMLDKRDVMKNGIRQIKEKYGIEGDYFIVCNQFWVHKNHMIVFEALSRAVLRDKHIKVVCTGNMQDYRSRKYIAEVRNYIAAQGLEEHLFLLGLVPKYDQIQLMKGAVAVIQPSLFEGWGTVLEDAKTLGKKALLSDIAVHHEQADRLCTFFDPHNAEQLAELMRQTFSEAGVEKTRYHYSLKSAVKYGKMFYEMIQQ